MKIDIKKFKRIYNISVLSAICLYIIAVIAISALSAHLESGVFITFGFEGYLLILGVMTLPFAVSLVGTALIVKESILYKRFNTSKRKFVLLTVAYSLIVIMGILAVVGFILTIIDIMLIIITALAIVSASLILASYIKKK